MSVSDSRGTKTPKKCKKEYTQRNTPAEKNKSERFTLSSRRRLERPRFRNHFSSWYQYFFGRLLVHNTYERRTLCTSKSVVLPYNFSTYRKFLFRVSKREIVGTRYSNSSVGRTSNIICFESRRRCSYTVTCANTE